MNWTEEEMRWFEKSEKFAHKARQKYRVSNYLYWMDWKNLHYYTTKEEAHNYRTIADTLAWEVWNGSFKPVR